MKSLLNFKQKIKVLFTDIDDTLTSDGKLTSQAYEMLWKLSDHGIHIVPVTGRPAGWCEMIARFWPVKAVIGENGAFYFHYDNHTMKRFFLIEETKRIENQKKLKLIETEVLSTVKGSALASDQFTRLFDLAIDFCEDVKRLSPQDISRIVSVFEKHGATAKVSSIHVNGWFGSYDKKPMCEVFYKNFYGQNLKDHQEECAFIGDSPNDEPLFGFFNNSFAVANILDFKDQLKSKPQYVTSSPAGKGFVEFGQHLLTLK